GCSSSTSGPTSWPGTCTGRRPSPRSGPAPSTEGIGPSGHASGEVVVRDVVAAVVERVDPDPGQTAAGGIAEDFFGSLPVLGRDIAVAVPLEPEPADHRCDSEDHQYQGDDHGRGPTTTAVP